MATKQLSARKPLILLLSGIALIIIGIAGVRFSTSCAVNDCPKEDLTESGIYIVDAVPRVNSTVIRISTGSTSVGILLILASGIVYIKQRVVNRKA